MTIRKYSRRDLIKIALCGSVSGALRALPSRPEISLESLLREMVNREALARFPNPTYTCSQASSYDRRSVRPDQPGWFANDDYSQFIRSERHGGRTEWVMMDSSGPGAIVRFWMGAPVPEHGPLGILRFYFDGSPAPGIEAPADKLLGGESFIGAPLSAVRSIGRNLYLPIPYSRGCKVTYDRPNYWQSKAQEDRTWYNISYRTYPAGTRVKTFSMGQFETMRGLVNETGSVLLAPSRHADHLFPAISPTRRTLGPGASATQTLRGPGAIRKLTLRVQAQNLTEALRQTILSMQCDGEQTVWSPVGDFFGSGLGFNPFRDWSRQVMPDGSMSCWWVMPFRERCDIQLQNQGRQAVGLELGPIEHGSWDWDSASMYFRASWRQQVEIETKKQDGLDWNYIDINGRGVYVGDTLSIHNGSSEWWGEGDEKIFVDRESFPSTFGTGTEDYYGYSFGDRGVFFEAPFHAQPRAQGNRSPGWTVDTRTRSLDAIPFTKSLKFDMEIWHWAKTTMTFAVTTYYYARPGSTSNRSSEPAEATRAIQM